MANSTIYPYGVGGQTPSGIGIVNDLVTGGADKALSAQQGVVIGDELYDDLAIPIDTETPELLNIFIDASSGNWTRYFEHYKGKIINISDYKGWPFKIGNKKFPSGNWFYRFAFLTDNTYSDGSSPNYSSVSPFTTQISVSSSADSAQWYEGVVPNDANYIYVYAYNDSNAEGYRDFPPDLFVLEANGVSRLGSIESSITGLDDIKDAWFDKPGTSIEYSVVGTDCRHQQTISNNGTTYTGSSASTVSCFPKSRLESDAVSRISDCYSVAELTSNVLDMKFEPLDVGSWLINIAEYNMNLQFIKRGSYVAVNENNNWEVLWTLDTNTAYFKILVCKKDANGNEIDANNVTFDTGFMTFTKGTVAQSGVPSRIAALESEKGGEICKFSVCSYNIGHFSLGKSSDTFVSDQKEDYDYTNYGSSTPYSNYDAQKTRWRNTLNEYSPDVLLMCEYITTFAHNQAGDVSTENAILSKYLYNRVGPLPSSDSYMRTAVFANIKLGTSDVTYFTNTVQAGRYYQCVEVNICGKDVKFVITHLDWNQGEYGATYRAEQIQKLITDFQNEEYVVICGDFNVSSISEFDSFANAGFTMANDGYLGEVPTYPASGTEVWSGGTKTVVDAARSGIDNIIVKGFAMSNIRVIDKKELSDHCAIMCDLTLIDNDG